MIETTKDLAWKEDIPQPFTSEEMTEIKSAISQETANVKIAPYHVYSPNEQIVGEWQQMVDGVLKKKPIYEKTWTGLNVTMVYNSWIPFISGVADIHIDFIVGVKIYRFTSSGIGIELSGSGYEVEYSSQGHADVLWIESNQNANLRTITGATIRYAKTTDEWEEV